MPKKSKKQDKSVLNYYLQFNFNCTHIVETCVKQQQNNFWVNQQVPGHQNKKKYLAKEYINPCFSTTRLYNKLLNMKQFCLDRQKLRK